MNTLGNQIIPQRIGCISPILDGRVCQTIAYGQSLQVDDASAVLLAELIQSKADGWDIVPAEACRVSRRRAAPIRCCIICILSKLYIIAGLQGPIPIQVHSFSLLTRYIQSLVTRYIQSLLR